MKKDPNESNKSEIKRLKKENEYLEAENAYLKKLMELNGTPADTFKKKQDIKQSEKS